MTLPPARAPFLTYAAGERTELFFRVNRVCGASTVEVDADGNRIAGFPRERLAPGEMERITLPRQLLERAAGKDLTVSIKEAQT